MSRIVTTKYVCDRCAAEFTRSNCFIVENMTFAASGYDDRGSGGHTVKDKEFCSPCSKQFYEWFNNRSAIRDAKGERAE